MRPTLDDLEVAFGVCPGATRVHPRMVLPRALGPFPHVSRHVEEAVTVRREHPHGRGSFPAMGTAVVEREVALPRVGE